MRYLLIGAVVVLGWCVAHSAMASTWESELRDQLREQKRAVHRDRDRLEDEVDRWHDAVDDQLDAQRRAALRATRGPARGQILRYYRAQEILLNQGREQSEDSIDRWRDDQIGLLETQYDALKRAARVPVIVQPVPVLPYDPSTFGTRPWVEAMPPARAVPTPAPQLVPPPAPPVPAPAPQLVPPPAPPIPTPARPLPYYDDQPGSGAEVLPAPPAVK